MIGTEPRQSGGRTKCGRFTLFEADKILSKEFGVIETFTILTTAANTVLAPIHDRMPVILPQTDYAQWLDPTPKNMDTLSPLLVPFPPGAMLVIPVSPRVNAPSNDDEKCIAPLP